MTRTHFTRSDIHTYACCFHALRSHRKCIQTHSKLHSHAQITAAMFLRGAAESSSRGGEAGAEMNRAPSTAGPASASAAGVCVCSSGCVCLCVFVSMVTDEMNRAPSNNAGPASAAAAGCVCVCKHGQTEGAILLTVCLELTHTNIHAHTLYTHRRTSTKWCEQQ